MEMNIWTNLSVADIAAYLPAGVDRAHRRWRTGAGDQREDRRRRVAAGTTPAGDEVPAASRWIIATRRC
jgi:hypothetical protein